MRSLRPRIVSRDDYVSVTLDGDTVTLHDCPRGRPLPDGTPATGSFTISAGAWADLLLAAGCDDWEEIS